MAKLASDFDNVIFAHRMEYHEDLSRTFNVKVAIIGARNALTDFCLLLIDRLKGHKLEFVVDQSDM